MIADMWESFTWAMHTCVAWVQDVIASAWETHPIVVVGVVITIATALVVTFRPAN